MDKLNHFDRKQLIGKKVFINTRELHNVIGIVNGFRGCDDIIRISSNDKWFKGRVLSFFWKEISLGKIQCE